MQKTVYTPKKCDVDLQLAKDGEEWWCFTGKSKTGKIQWEYGEIKREFKNQRVDLNSESIDVMSMN